MRFRLISWVLSALLFASTSLAGTVILYPLDGMVTTEVGGVVVGFSNMSANELITIEVNNEKHEVDLWDGTFDLDTDWVEGENVIKVGTETVTFIMDEYAKKPKEPSIHDEIFANCGNCHNLGPDLDLTLRAELETLCSGCHEERHQALHHGGMGCSDCHLSHTSWYPDLLINSGNTLCLTCHEELEAAGAQSAHGTVWSELECVQCHLSGHAPTVETSEGLCADCHQDQSVMVPGHADVVRAACQTCHNMHGEAGSGQWKPSQESCMGCHESQVAEAHLGVDEKCGDCHGIHVAKSPHEQDAELCSGCHDDYSTKKRLHGPEAKGVCGACHPIHDLGNTASAILGCVKCHDLESLRGDHTGSISGLGTCVLCHRLHTSDEPNFLPPHEHAPFALRDCNACHNWPGFTADRKLEGPWGDFCLSCHPAKRANLNHAPAKAGDCKVCHTPHAGDRPRLLVREEVSLCGQCHEKTSSLWDEKGAHDKERGCRFCHDPHGTEQAKLLLFDLQKSCQACHRDPTLGFGDVVRPYVHGPMNMDNCLICHDWHFNGSDAYLAGSAAEQCMQCHEINLISSDELLAPKVHGALLTGRCGACHDAHAADNPKFLRVQDNDMCLVCHKELKHRHPFSTQTRVQGIHIPSDWPRSGDKLGCLGCHEAHESPIGNLLVTSRGVLCKSCHK